jgi:hypothetical protein
MLDRSKSTRVVVGLTREIRLDNGEITEIVLSQNPTSLR